MIVKVLSRQRRDELVDQIRDAEKTITDLSDNLRRARDGINPYGGPDLEMAGYIMLAKGHVDNVYQLLEYAIQNLAYATTE